MPFAFTMWREIKAIKYFEKYHQRNRILSVYFKEKDHIDTAYWLMF